MPVPTHATEPLIDQPAPAPGSPELGDEPLFLGRDEASGRRLRQLTDGVIDQLERRWATPRGAWSGADGDELAAAVARLDPCPDDGIDLDDLLDEVGSVVLANSLRITDPATIAHLQCPTLLPAAAAELAISLTNQSMDTYDQAPAATLVEDHLVRWLARLAGLPAEASGVLTAGGTASNLLGLLLAREHAGAARGHAVAARGLPPDAARWRVVCSDAAHFSVSQAVGILGLGREAVTAVGTDALGRLDLDDLDATLDRLRRDGMAPIALVATAGTTDLGAVDPLDALADRAAEHGLWYHVDAAVGAAFLLSEHLAPRLAGLERADSITADLHKLWWQPIGASALLVRDEHRYDAISLHTTYLNRRDDEDRGALNLVNRSIDTSRRFDALKVLLSLRSVGRRRLASMVERLVALADAAGELVTAHPELELAAPPQSVTCVFRWRPQPEPGPRPALGDLALDGRALDAANTEAQRRLFASGEAVVGRTEVGGATSLKLTLVNPLTTEADLARLLERVAAVAREAAAPPAPAGPSAAVPSTALGATDPAGAVGARP